jgi:hypothetical protein
MCGHTVNSPRSARMVYGLRHDRAVWQAQHTDKSIFGFCDEVDSRGVGKHRGDPANVVQAP